MEKIISVVLDVNNKNRGVEICVAPTYKGTMQDLVEDAKLVVSKDAKNHALAARKGIVRGPWHEVSADIRDSLARGGHLLDMLIKDKDVDVRKTIAYQGYGLDKLVHDKDHSVRRVVAEQGYGLDILINDKNEHVRAAVARKGYGLDVLVHDKSVWVRYAVAKRGYGLDILINDEKESIRRIAADMLARQATR